MWRGSFTALTLLTTLAGATTEELFPERTCEAANSPAQCWNIFVQTHTHCEPFKEGEHPTAVTVDSGANSTGPTGIRRAFDDAFFNSTG